MFTIQVLEVKIESLKNECHLIIICKLGHYCLLTENCFDRSVVECKYVGWRWSQRWARWHQGWMSPWGTTIATLAIPLSTLQDASLLPHLTNCALCSRCKTIATLDLYFENRSVIFNVSSGYCQPCLILYHLHRSPQSATLDHTISFLAFTELHTLDCAHQPAWWGILSRASSHGRLCKILPMAYIASNSAAAAEEQCRRAGEVMRRADGFPARGRRLSLWQRTDLWIHNAYVNPQMVPLDSFSDVKVFWNTVHPS